MGVRTYYEIKKYKYMANQFLDWGGLVAFYEKIKSYIYSYTYSKDDLYTKTETYNSSEIDSEITQLNDKLNSLIFIGTMKDYEEDYAAGKIAINTLVVITDQNNETTSDATSSILGKGVLGQMILG